MTTEVYINQYKYTASLSITLGEKLNKMLGSCTFTIPKTTVRKFKRNSLVRIITSGKEFRFLLTNDVVERTPINSNFYRHTITATDETKKLEGIYYGSKTITQPSDRAFSFADMETYQGINAITKQAFFTLQEENNLVGYRVYGTVFNLLPITSYITNAQASVLQGGGFYVRKILYSILEYDRNSQLVQETKVVDFETTTIQSNDIINQQFAHTQTHIFNGQTRKYAIRIQIQRNSDSAGSYTSELYVYSIPIILHDEYNRNIYFACDSIINAVNQNKKANLTDSAYLNTSRLTFPKTYTDEENTELNKVSPEFSFTRQNVRESFQTIGGYINAEPYLYQNKVKFLFYTAKGENWEDKISKLERDEYTSDIEQGCDNMLAYIDNAIDRSKTIIEPFNDGTLTLRAETPYTRLTDTTNIVLPTTNGINRVKRVYVWTSASNRYDITQFVYERQVYNTQLSDFTSDRAFSKSYALYYTNGGKNIQGFLYKNTNIQGGVWNNYAITNILQSVGAGTFSNIDDILKFAFEIEYEPFYSELVFQSKTHTNDMLFDERTINFTQQSNSVDRENFGRSMMSNTQKSGLDPLKKTYTTNDIDNIPINDQSNRYLHKWNDEYVISEVDVEINYNKYIVTLTLSKYFNYISEYVGLPTYKRTYNISETMVHDRVSLWNDYFVITKYDVDYTDNLFCGELRLLNAIKYTFTDETGIVSGASIVYETYSKDGFFITDIIKPISVKPYGNSIQFSFNMEDNYSAGLENRTITILGIDNKYTTATEYSDYDGNYAYDRYRIGAFPQITDGYLNSYKDKVPFGDNISTQIATSGSDVLVNSKFELVEKDNRETMHKVYNVSFVTTEDIIIGEALSSGNRLFKGKGTNTETYIVFLDYKLSNILPKISTQDLTNFANIVKIKIGTNDCTVNNAKHLIELLGKTAPTTANGKKSWAYVKSGEVLFGANEDIIAGQVYGNYNIVGCHNLNVYKGD